MTLRQAEVIASLAKNGMNARAASRDMFLHYHTVLYHIKMIQRDTGLNPRDYQDFGVLLEMAKKILEENKG